MGPLNIARSFLRRHMSGWVAMGGRVLQTGKFGAFLPEGGNRCYIVYIILKIITNIRNIEGKAITKCLTHLFRIDFTPP